MSGFGQVGPDVHEFCNAEIDRLRVTLTATENALRDVSDGYERRVTGILDRWLPPHPDNCDEGSTQHVCVRCDVMANMRVAFGFARPLAAARVVVSADQPCEWCEKHGTCDPANCPKADPPEEGTLGEGPGSSAADSSVGERQGRQPGPSLNVLQEQLRNIDDAALRKYLAADPPEEGT